MALLAIALAQRGDVAGALTGVPLLAPLVADEVGALAKQVQRLAFARGETIVREGEAGDSFYLVERGIIAVTPARKTLSPTKSASPFIVAAGPIDMG